MFVCSQTKKDFLLRLNSALFFPSLELTLFNILADWDPVFKIYIGAIAWHRRESLAFIASMCYQGLIYYFVKYFRGYIFVYIKLSPVPCTFHMSLLFSVVFFMDTMHIKCLQDIERLQRRSFMNDYEQFCDLLFSFV